MNFEYKIDNDDGVVNVKLKGYLDATNASGLLEDMKQFIGTTVKKIIFDAAELEYIASAGLRVIIFTKQKIGYDCDVVLKSPQEAVVSVIEMSGLNNFVTIE